MNFKLYKNDVYVSFEEVLEGLVILEIIDMEIRGFIK
jgi:hypothetical protein